MTAIDENLLITVGATSDEISKWDLFRERIRCQSYPLVEKENSLILQGDARNILEDIPDESVDCVITSPPYGGLKDYGSEGQIGFGQRCEEEYLPDLQKVFEQLYRSAKTGAALWVVLDMLKEKGKAVLLPWEIVSLAQKAGWVFNDLVVWDKGKSLPWSNHGRFRGVCEYILLLGKGKLTNFNIDAARDIENLSSYWVKYPERYHPDGKAPSDLWHFPIPTQGSWSKQQSRHHCPFPVQLVARMLAISTKVGDIVLDPFAGTGSVAAIANHIGRRGIGIELNPVFVQEYNDAGFSALTSQASEQLIRTASRGLADGGLRSPIINLRMLKFPKELFAQIARANILGSTAREYIGAFVLTTAQIHDVPDNENLVSGNLGTINISILLKHGADKGILDAAIKQKLSVAPLSIFGLNIKYSLVSDDVWLQNAFSENLSGGMWCVYRNGRFYKRDEQVDAAFISSVIQSDITQNNFKVPSIYSQVNLNMEDSIHK